MKKTVPMILVALALTGCATQAKFKAKMDGFVGKPEIEVISAYGPPQGVYRLQDGSKVVQYRREGELTMPGITTYSPVTTQTTGQLTENRGIAGVRAIDYTGTSTTYRQERGPSFKIPVLCEINFTIDSSGVVQKWSSRGNDC